MEANDANVINEVSRRARVIFLALLPTAFLFLLLFLIGKSIVIEKGSDFLFERFLYFILGIDIGLWFSVFIILLAMQPVSKKENPEKEIISPKAE